MWRLPIVLAALVALYGSAMVAPARWAEASGTCTFVLGFATLQALIPQQVGSCLEDEQHNPQNGDGLQQTSGGLLVWRKADNFTAFTDGYHTWVNGPYGVQERLNTQRFSWEANPTGLPVVPGTSGGSVGYLAGRATIGPLQSVGTGGGTPPPAVCTARGLTIDAADSSTPVTSFSLQPDCTFRVALPAGTYIVLLTPHPIDTTKDLPATIQIKSGQTVHLDITIDTGIR